MRKEEGRRAGGRVEREKEELDQIGSKILLL